jgi:hypothetical protein
LKLPCEPTIGESEAISKVEVDAHFVPKKKHVEPPFDIAMKQYFKPLSNPNQ